MLVLVMKLFVKHVNAADVPSTLEIGSEPFLDNVDGGFLGNHSFSQRDYVRIVVLLGFAGRFLVPAQGATNSGYFVGSHRFAISTSP